MATKRVLLFIASILALAACSGRGPLDIQEVREKLPFIHDGRSTKQDILERFGAPSNSYENGRILTYFMQEANGRLQVHAGQPFRWRLALVLVFGADGVLNRHSLVRR